jgi:hypothetical protein
MAARKKKVAKKKTKRKVPPKRRERTVQMDEGELALYVQKKNTSDHCGHVYRATLTDLQVYQGFLKNRYTLPEDFEINLNTGVITSEAK